MEEWVGGGGWWNGEVDQEREWTMVSVGAGEAVQLSSLGAVALPT